MASKGPLPRKVDGLHVQELDGEFVVVNEATTQAHALSGTAAALWTGIDAGSWPSASDEDLELAVAELQTLGLIQSAGLSRRTLMRGGTIAVAGAVITIGLPSIAAAASGTTPTGTTLSSNPVSPNQGATYTLTATVTGVGATGTVVFFNNTTSTEVGSQALAGTTAAITVTASATEPNESFTATYSGDGTFAGSTGNATVVYAVVAQPKTTPTMNVGGINTQKNKAYTATVTVTGLTGFPTGNVTVSGSGATFAAPTTAALDGAGQATFAITNPPGAGTACSVTFAYAGDSQYNATSVTQAYDTTNSDGSPLVPLVVLP